MRDEPLRSGTCAACGSDLKRALIEEVRRYEQTRLLEVTCPSCENSFFAVHVESARKDAIEINDVVAAARVLRSASRLSELFGSADLPGAA